jgi:hypothetical protein
MKKLLIISVLLCFAGFKLLAVNPIPSYNVLVQGKVTFQEAVPSVGGGAGLFAKEKRMMNIQTHTASPSTGIKLTSIIAITVYRLDHRISYGPYYIYCGQSLSIGIDNSYWGVDVYTADLARVSVWTSEQH